MEPIDIFVVFCIAGGVLVWGLILYGICRYSASSSDDYQATLKHLSEMHERENRAWVSETRETRKRRL